MTERDIYGVKLQIGNGKPRTYWPVNVVVLVGALGVFLGVALVILALQAGVLYWSGKGGSVIPCERAP